MLARERIDRRRKRLYLRKRTGATVIQEWIIWICVGFKILFLGGSLTHMEGSGSCRIALALLLTARKASPKGLTSREATSQARFHLGPPPFASQYSTQKHDRINPLCGGDWREGKRGVTTNKGNLNTQLQASVIQVKLHLGIDILCTTFVRCSAQLLIWKGLAWNIKMSRW